MAIAISVKKGITDEGASKFFGDPTVPAEWENEFADEVIFLCQIRLKDIAALDAENVLPRSGYLYIFLDTSCYPYEPMIRINEGEPDTVLECFNDISEEFTALTVGWEMSFSPTDDTAEGIRLFGKPTDWSYAEQPPKLLLQYDPLATDMPFIEDVDGFVYLFYKDDVTKATLHIERS